MTSATPTRPSRRAEQRAQVRTAVLDAAAAFIAEGDPSKYNADALAARAGIARRTIFNHFGSLDEVIAGVCLREMTMINEGVRAAVLAAPAADQDPVSSQQLFTELASALCQVESAGVILFIRDAGRFQSSRHAVHSSGGSTFLGASEQLVDVLLAKYPSAVRLEVMLIVGAVVHGYVTISGLWLTEAERAGESPDLAGWEVLLDQLLSGAWAGWRD